MPTGRRGLSAGLAALLFLLPPHPAAPASPSPGPAGAEPLQPYRVTEFPIYRGPGFQNEPALAWDWVMWRDAGPYPMGGSRPVLRLRQLDTGAQLDLPAAGRAALVDGFVVTEEQDAEYRRAILAYPVPEGEPFTIVPSHDALRGTPTGLLGAAGSLAVLGEGRSPVTGTRLYDLAAQKDVPVPSGTFDDIATLGRVGVSHPWLVWRDRRHVPREPVSVDADLYAYHLSTGETRRLSARPEPVSDPAISGSIVVWTTIRQQSRMLVAYDLNDGRERLLAEYPVEISRGPGTPPDIDGDLVVWSALGATDYDIQGYDLKRGQPFLITRAVGDQTAPRISGRRAVWADGRHGNIAKYEADTDIYGALLAEEPAPAPAAWGVPQAIDAKIEAVWGEGRPVAQAERAVVDAWVFQRETAAFAACMWNPRLQLWKAVDNEPARPAAVTVRNGNFAVPTWSFHRVDVSEARDPARRIYFFVGLDGVPAASNVWAHAAEEARTIHPVPVRPTGVAAAGESVDARIELVWPHGGAPVERAERANITAMLFQPDSLVSVPSDWSPTVRLLRSLNDGVAREAALGTKRIVREGTLTYPVWDFNDIDVEAAQDRANTYYFRVGVDGVQTYTNVWAHGQDGRTYFPRRDTPTVPCAR